MGLLARVRESLIKIPESGADEFFLASCRGMIKALGDPYTKLMLNDQVDHIRRTSSQRGIGVELGPNAGAGPMRVTLVLAGGPAQKAGIRPGDEITHLNGTSVEGLTSAQVQNSFEQGYVITAREDFVPTADGKPAAIETTIRRAGVKDSWKVALRAEQFRPELVYGVNRKEDDVWDYMLDRERKITYLRVGVLNTGASDEMEKALGSIPRDELRGLILDLRWSPYGLLTEGLAVPALFQRERLIAQLKGRSNGIESTTPLTSPEHRKCRYPELPIVVLVNGQTSGCSELVAAALQESKRVVIVGQRTFGKASVQNDMSINATAAYMLMTTGIFTTGGGRVLHRFPESKPTDDWGVRPDPGHELRISAELNTQLRDWWILQSLRPGSSRERLPLDDLTKDPQLQAALKVFK